MIKIMKLSPVSSMTWDDTNSMQFMLFWVIVWKNMVFSPNYTSQVHTHALGVRVPEPIWFWTYLVLSEPIWTYSAPIWFLTNSSWNQIIFFSKQYLGITYSTSATKWSPQIRYYTTRLSIDSRIEQFGHYFMPCYTPIKTIKSILHP